MTETTNVQWHVDFHEQPRADYLGGNIVSGQIVGDGHYRGILIVYTDDPEYIETLMEEDANVRSYERDLSSHPDEP